jgi:hypothetical protein
VLDRSCGSVRASFKMPPRSISPLRTGPLRKDVHHLVRDCAQVRITAANAICSPIV